MENVRLTVFARSDVGRVRTSNEDAFLLSDLDSGDRLAVPAIDVDVSDRGILMVVSDGMGGHAAGEVASGMVVESLRRSLSNHAGDPQSLGRLIDHAVDRANAEVHEAAHSSDKHGMGATLTAVLVHNKEAYVAEVGDSRGYLLRGQRLKQITKDQSFVQALVDSGVMTPEQATTSSRKNMILQAMGKNKDVEAWIGRISLCRGDRLLLCSDGLSNFVPNAELETLLGGPDLATICDRMIDLANERGGKDNLTAVVAVAEGEGLPQPIANASMTQSIQVLQEYKGLAGGLDTAPRAPRADPPAPAPKAPKGSSESGRGWLIGGLVLVIALALLAVALFK